MTTIPAETVRTTLEDTTAEQVCFQHAWSVLGDKSAARKIVSPYLKAVSEVNPGLAALGSLLPLGTRIELPEFTIDDDLPVVRLWDEA